MPRSIRDFETWAPLLTSHVLHPKTSWTGAARIGLPAAAMIHSRAVRSVAAAANPDLEVLQFGVWEDAPSTHTTAVTRSRT